MLEIAAKPIHIFLNFNAVIVNLDSLPLEIQQSCVNSIEKNIKTLKTYPLLFLKTRWPAPECASHLAYHLPILLSSSLTFAVLGIMPNPSTICIASTIP